MRRCLLVVLLLSVGACGVETNPSASSASAGPGLFTRQP